jgi:hypothetical protein
MGRTAPELNDLASALYGLGKAIQEVAIKRLVRQLSGDFFGVALGNSVV